MFCVDSHLPQRAGLLACFAQALHEADFFPHTDEAHLGPAKLLLTACIGEDLSLLIVQRLKPSA